MLGLIFSSKTPWVAQIPKWVASLPTKGVEAWTAESHLSRPPGEEAAERTTMKKSPAFTSQPTAKGQTRDRERRISAGYLRLLHVILSPSPSAKGRGARSERSSLSSKVQGPKSGVGGPECQPQRRPAAVGYLARFLCAGCALALLASGCAGPRPLKGGKAAITRKPAGVVEQTVVQGENAAQPSNQNQETVKVRSFTVPAGSRVEASPAQSTPPAQPAPAPSASQPPSTLNSQPSTAYILSAPMPVIEREETRAKTELGAAQKDTGRDLAAKLSSLKGIVWVGVGLFIFGLASLVYPPLKLIVASVTTSVALMLGGVALIVLPTMLVGNELLILGAVGLAVGAWFLAHRHGQLSGIVAASRPSLPASAGGEQSAEK